MRRELTGFGELVSCLGIAARNPNGDAMATARARGYAKASAELQTKAATGAILGSDGFLTSDPLANLALGTIARASLAGSIFDAARPAGGWHQRVIATDTAKLTAPIIGEGLPIPVYNTAASSILLTPEKIGIGLVYSNEMLGDPGAVATIEHDFAIIAQRGVDAAILAAVAPDSSFGFAATDDPLADCETLLGALGDLSGIGAPTLAASPKTLLHIATRRDSGGYLFGEVGLSGGHLLNCEIFPCDALPDGVIRAVSGEALMMKLGDLVISASSAASVQMATNPTQDATQGTGSTAVSMFAANSTAVGYWISWAIVKLRDTASAELDGVMEW